MCIVGWHNNPLTIYIFFVLQNNEKKLLKNPCKSHTLHKKSKSAYAKDAENKKYKNNPFV